MMEKSSTCTSLTSRVTRVIIFDVREAGPKDPRFVATAQALYHTMILGSFSHLTTFTHLSLIVVTKKGYEYLLDLCPLNNLKKYLKKVFGRLKQTLCYLNQATIFSKRGSFESILMETVHKYRHQFSGSENDKNNRLELTVLTSFEEQSIIKEAETLLYKTDFIHVHKLRVVHLLKSSIRDQISTWNETIRKKLVVENLVANEKDARQFFKNWLMNRSNQWLMVLANCDLWKVTVDLEQVLLDSNLWPVGSSEVQTKFDERATTKWEKVREKRLEILEWIRADGFPMSLVYGMPQRVVATEDFDSNSSLEENRSQFVSLWNWLTKDKLVGLVRLFFRDRIPSFFVLIPGNDRSLLMREVAPRELILPLQNYRSELDLDLDEVRDESYRQSNYDDVHLASVQIPHLMDYDPDVAEAGFVPVLERKLQEIVTNCSVPELKLQSPFNNRK